MTLILIDIIANTECHQSQHNADTGPIDQFGESTVPTSDRWYKIVIPCLSTCT